jgi:hypothetical protein
MGLKGYRLWVMGQLDSTCRAPPRVHGDALPEAPPERLRRRVARTSKTNVKQQTLKPGYHFVGSRVETRALSSALGQQLGSTCTALPPPPPGPRCSAAGCI